MTLTEEMLARGRWDIYEAGEDLLLVASDRISAFDVVLPTPIRAAGADRGLAVLVRGYQGPRPQPRDHRRPVEVPRRSTRPGTSWPAGRCWFGGPRSCPWSAWPAGISPGPGGRTTGEPAACGIRLPAGLVESERLPAAIFTPTTKAVTGHDEPLTFEEMTKLIGGDLSDRLRSLTLGLYAFAAERACSGGSCSPTPSSRFGFVDGELDAGRRGAHPGLVPVLAGRPVRRGRIAALVRQAVRPRLAGRKRLEPRPAPPDLPPGRGRADRVPLPGGVRADHRGAVRRLPEADGSRDVNPAGELTRAPRHPVPGGGGGDPQAGPPRPAGQGGGGAARPRLPQRVRGAGRQVDRPHGDAPTRRRPSPNCTRCASGSWPTRSSRIRGWYPSGWPSRRPGEVSGPLVGVVTFPGSLDDRDALRALAFMGGDPVPLWHGDPDLRGAKAVVLPGGSRMGTTSGPGPSPGSR